MVEVSSIGRLLVMEWAAFFEEKVVNSILESVTLKKKKLSVVKFKEQMEKLN